MRIKRGWLKKLINRIKTIFMCISMRHCTRYSGRRIVHRPHEKSMKSHFLQKISKIQNPRWPMSWMARTEKTQYASNGDLHFYKFVEIFSIYWHFQYRKFSANSNRPLFRAHCVYFTKRALNLFYRLAWIASISKRAKNNNFCH